MVAPHSWHTLTMRFLALLPALLLAVALPAAHAEWVDLGGGALEVRAVEYDGERTVIEMSLGGFTALPEEIDGKTYHQIFLGSESRSLESGFPALPDVCRSVLIPGDRRMQVRVLETEYVDLVEMPVAPSKGNLPRTVDPRSVPYTFDAFYEGSGVYPASVAEGRTPYILRDFRGLVVDLNVFQYLPAEETLRVYTRLVVEIAPDGPAEVNPLSAGRPQVIDRQFDQLYRQQFLNYGLDRYDPVLEDGGLLIITYDSFYSAVLPLQEWKLQRGLPTELVTLSEIGSTTTQIKNYITNAYNTQGIAYVLLVGDAAQVPTFSHAGGGSDPTYACIAGSDYYPDLFVGRFSAENTAHVDTQVQRTIHYERDVLAGESWMQSGTGIASNQGPGHYGEYDNEHMDYIRDDLLGYGYLAVDQIYDPYATSSQVANALNAGRGIVNYCGHGSTTSWGSSGFSNTHVNALTNDNMLPFICSVACVNGNFTGSTCFGEAWLRATNGGAPTGAIAAYMSSINQSWNPPMYAEDEVVDLLVADAMRTVGGLFFNGSCYMMDTNPGSSGYDMFLTWIIFGDPSVAVRTMQTESMLVSHPGTLFLGNHQYAIQTGVAGATCALYGNGVLYGTATADGVGGATITLDPLPAEPMALSLTVTAYNKQTYLGTVDVVPAEGPYLIVDEVIYHDSGLDGMIQAGESVLVQVKLRNVGIETAVGISASLSDPGEEITLEVDTQTWPDLEPEQSAWADGMYSFTVDPGCPDMTAISMPLVITGEERISWETNLGFVIHAPAISVVSVEIDDTLGGDGNFRLDPGENATLTVTLHNAGSGTLNDIAALLSCGHPRVHITQAAAGHLGLGTGQNGVLLPVFEISIDENFLAYDADLDLQITGWNDYDQSFVLTVPIGGFYETIEDGPGEWSHYVVTDPGFTDQWHVSDQRNHTPNGAHSWKCGSSTTGDYANLLDAALVTPPVLVTGEVSLTFWMWIEAEESGYHQGRAYDGGLIEMSVDGGPFAAITPVGGYTHTIRAGSVPGPFPEDTPVFSGSMDWTQVTCDLGPMDGEAVFRFRFGSDGADTREGWYIDDVEIFGLGSWAGIGEDAPRAVRLSLAPSHPNPTQARARIEFAVPASGPVALEVFDASGRLVRTLLNEPLTAGTHSVAWEGRDDGGRSVASGLYFYRLNTKDGTLQRSLVLLR